MSRATVILYRDADRAKAAKWAQTAPAGTVVEFRESKRTIPQNSRLHAMLTTLARQLAYHGQRLDVDDWKLVFLDALNREVRIVPALDGQGFVNLGRKTSKLTKDECTALMDLIEAFAAQHGVDLRERGAA
jgi:hypothetical protein